MSTAAVNLFGNLLFCKFRKEAASSSSSSSSRYKLCTLNPHLGSSYFSAWSGLNQLGRFSFDRIEEGGRCKGNRMVIRASFFGVGAPEAVVVGAVALLVFGPRGLAEVAGTLGKTLRTFQPTIKELREVTREFKSTLENEIGLADQVLSTYSPIMEAVLPPTPSEVSATSDSPPSTSENDATTETPVVSASTPTDSEVTDTNASQKAAAMSALNL